jgi:hypothetical protein
MLQPSEHRALQIPLVAAVPIVDLLLIISLIAAPDCPLLLIS